MTAWSAGDDPNGLFSNRIGAVPTETMLDESRGLLGDGRPCGMHGGVDRFANGINVMLNPEHAARLERLARLAGVPEGTLARSLLAKAIEESDPDGRDILAILDGIPSAYEHAIQSLEQADAGETIALDDL